MVGLFGVVEEDFHADAFDVVDELFKVTFKRFELHGVDLFLNLFLAARVVLAFCELTERLVDVGISYPVVNVARKRVERFQDTLATIPARLWRRFFPSVSDEFIAKFVLLELFHRVLDERVAGAMRFGEHPDGKTCNAVVVGESLKPRSVLVAEKRNLAVKDSGKHFEFFVEFFLRRRVRVDQYFLPHTDPAKGVHETRLHVDECLVGEVNSSMHEQYFSPKSK